MLLERPLTMHVHVDQDPAVARWRLRVWLRRARLDCEQTQKEVAAALDWSPSKLLRIEKGSVHISITDLQALLNHYGLRDPQVREQLLELAKVGKRQPWARYRGVLRPEYISYLGHESAASMVRSFQPLVLPGMLQTDEYARAAMREQLVIERPGSAGDSATVESLLEARRQRRELLSRSDAPRMLYIIDEGVIRRQVGGTQVMVAQLEHLAKLARNPRVDIRILLFGAGAHPGMAGAFVILEFPEADDDDLLYLEDARGELTVREQRADASAYKEVFYRLEELATPADQLEQTVEQVISDIRRTGGV